MNAESIRPQNPFGDTFIDRRSEKPKLAGWDGISGSRSIARDAYVARPVRLAFYFYVATIPFETVDLGVPIEITTLSLGLLLLSLIFQPQLCLKRPPLAFVLFLVYLAIFALLVYTSTPRIYLEEAEWQLMVITQLMIMSWVAFNVMKSQWAARGALLTLAFACLVLAVLQHLGISGVVLDAGQDERVTSFGFHPNNMARILTIGLLVIAGLTYAVPKGISRSRLWILAWIAVIGIAIVQTGSRGGLLALAAGLLVFVLKDGAASTKFRNASIVLIGIICFTALVFQSEVNRTRFESALEQGDLARREKIYPEAWKMFRQKPLLGWGPKVNEYELGARLAHPDEVAKNPHNLILFVLVSTGLVGAIPFLAGIGLTVRTAWKARHGIRGVLPLSLVAAVIVANMSGVWMTSKLHWLVTAYALSSAYLFGKQGGFKRIGVVAR